MNDFVPNKLGFDADACMGYIKKIINAYLDNLSLRLQLIVATEIVKNGNGSHVMKQDAFMSVGETNREITDDHILLEVGIDTEKLKGQNEDLFVRVSVVLHGNMNGDSWTWRDARVMYTKPGVATYGKHVRNKRVHVPKEMKPRALPGFAQSNKFTDIVAGVERNVEKNIEKYVNDFIDGVSGALDRINWSAFITGG